MESEFSHRPGDFQFDMRVEFSLLVQAVSVHTPGLIATTRWGGGPLGWAPQCGRKAACWMLRLHLLISEAKGKDFVSLVWDSALGSCVTF